MTEKLNLGLNEAQLKAVTAPMGPVLILAGAGSGKTRALSMRIVYLIKKLGMDPENILAVTFTNKAAGEMKERILKLLRREDRPLKEDGPVALPAMGTFHSIGARILRTEGRRLGLSPNFLIYDTSDQESLLKEVLAKLRIDATKFKPSLFAHVIDRAKNNLIEPEDYNDDDNDNRFNDMARRVFVQYQESLRQNNAVDFGDLLVLPVKLFRDHPEILKKYQDKWQYVLVDEYQDTNQVQYTFTKLLVSKRKNIFVVGDDAQAIYGFRGANLQNILDFEEDYPDASIYRLEQNYRSTAQILAIAEKIIELSPRQHKKKLWTENHNGQAPVLFRAEDEMVEAWFVARKIIELQDGSPGEITYDYDDDSILSRVMRRARQRVLPKLKNRQGLNNFAVLYRTHAQSRAVEEVMIESGIPYQIIGGLKFYERKEIKDLLAYLKLLVNPNDLVSLKRVINVPPRGIGPKSFDLLKEALLEKKDKALAKLFDEKPAVKIFFEIVDAVSSLDETATLPQIMSQVLKMTGYESFLRDGSEEAESRWENVQELFNVATSFEKFNWKEGLTRFLEEVSLMTNVDELDPATQKVTLMTLHQAKGLEFDTVFLIGLEEGILPHARSIMEAKDVAEEIRLAYVGVTRARKNLFLIYCSSRKQFGTRNMSVPSRILKAIPEELLDVYEF
ncbi:MAG: UvrD-helicase domain-containing protein [Candidatus Doudnabacteria bacterium]|nr:UvrD-helicase domain-containing protein [Candidatus Doudnabacteria bacterium]